MYSTKIQALIISATKWNWAYHQLKNWGYNKDQIKYIASNIKENRMVTGNTEYIMNLLYNHERYLT